MIFSNSYSRGIYRQQQARKEHSEKITNGAEKFKDTARKVAEDEYRCEETTRMYKDLARYYRMRLNPPDEIRQNIYERG